MNLEDCREGLRVMDTMAAWYYDNSVRVGVIACVDLDRLSFRNRRAVLVIWENSKRRASWKCADWLEPYQQEIVDMRVGPKLLGGWRIGDRVRGSSAMWRQGTIKRFRTDTVKAWIEWDGSWANSWHPLETLVPALPPYPRSIAGAVIALPPIVEDDEPSDAFYDEVVAAIVSWKAGVISRDQAADLMMASYEENFPKRPMRAEDV